MTVSEKITAHPGFEPRTFALLAPGSTNWANLQSWGSAVDVYSYRSSVLTPSLHHLHPRSLQRGLGNQFQIDLAINLLYATWKRLVLLTLTDLYNFCKREEEEIQHFFWDCVELVSFWHNIQSHILKISVDLNMRKSHFRFIWYLKFKI